MEESGRPVIRTVIETDSDGSIATISLVQSDPAEGRSLQWTQQIDVLIGTSGSIETIPVELAAERVDVADASSIRPDFVLPSGSGLAYGDIVLDERSRAYLLERLGEFDDAVTRGAVWVTLWEEMLGGRILPQALMDLALDVIAVEDTEQIVQLLLNGIGSLYWRHLPASEREELAPEARARYSGRNRTVGIVEPEVGLLFGFLLGRDECRRDRFSRACMEPGGVDTGTTAVRNR